MSGTANRIVKNTGFLYAKMGVSVFITLLTTRLVLNALGVSDFGIFGVVGGAIALLGFLSASMSNATQRFMSYSQGQKDKKKQILIYNNSLIIHILIAVFLIIALELLAHPMFRYILNIPAERVFSAQCIYQFMIISTSLTIISAPFDAAINAHEDMKFYALAGIFESLLKLLIALIVVYSLYDKLVVYGILMASLTIILLIVKYSYCKMRYMECRFSLRKYFDKQTTKEMVSFASWNFIDTMGSLIGNNGGDLVMNHFLGPSINAAGNIGSQLRGQMLAFSNSMLKALNPVIIKKEGEKDRKGMLVYTLTGSKLSFLLFAFLALPFVIDAPYILKLWLKNVPDWVVVFSRIQMLTGLGEQVTIVLGTALFATGVIKSNSIYSGIAHVVPLFFYVLLLSNGVEPYWIYLIILFNFVFIIGGYKVYLCHKHCELNVGSYIKDVVIPSLLCSLASLLAGWMICQQFEASIGRLLLIIIVVDTVLFISSYCILLNNSEKNYIISTASILIKRII